MAFLIIPYIWAKSKAYCLDFFNLSMSEISNSLRSKVGAVA